MAAGAVLGLLLSWAAGAVAGLLFSSTAGAVLGFCFSWPPVRSWDFCFLVTNGAGRRCCLGAFAFVAAGAVSEFFLFVAGCRGCGYHCFNLDAAGVVYYVQFDDHRRGDGSVGFNFTVTKES